MENKKIACWELTNLLQNYCHDGGALDEVTINVKDTNYKVKGVELSKSKEGIVITILED